jgi:hypothetical protein
MATLVVLVVAGGAIATPIVDYFDYGAAGNALKAFGTAGGGWAGAWSLNGMLYLPTPNLTYTAAGYNGADNLTTTGCAGTGSGAAAVTQRSLSTPMTGTFYVSAIVSYDGSSDMLLWLDRPETTNNFVAIRAGAAKTRFNGTDNTGKAIASGTHLLLAKLTVSAGSDTLDFWVDPNLSGGEAGLPTADISKSGSDAYGTSFSGVGISGTTNNRLDALRIGTFNEVVGVPEPATLGLVALGGLMMIFRRRHA